MNQDAQGGSTEQGEILVVKLASLPEDVTTAISFVNVYTTGKTFEDAADLTVQLDDVSAIVDDYDAGNNGGQSLTVQLREGAGELLARSTAGTVENLNAATGMLLGAFNRLSDGSWYFESILGLAEGTCKEPSDAGMQNAFNAYVVTVDEKRAAEETKRAEEEAAAAAEEEQAAAAAAAAAEAGAGSTTSAPAYNVDSDRIEITFALPFPAVDVAVEVVEEVAEGRILSATLDGDTGITTAGVWVHRPGVGVDGITINLKLTFAVDAHALLTADGTTLTATMRSVYIFPTSASNAVPIEVQELSFEVQEPDLNALSVATTDPVGLGAETGLRVGDAITFRTTVTNGAVNAAAHDIHLTLDLDYLLEPPGENTYGSMCLASCTGFGVTYLARPEHQLVLTTDTIAAGGAGSFIVGWTSAVSSLGSLAAPVGSVSATLDSYDGNAGGDESGRPGRPGASLTEGADGIILGVVQMDASSIAYTLTSTSVPATAGVAITIHEVVEMVFALVVPEGSTDVTIAFELLSATHSADGVVAEETEVEIVSTGSGIAAETVALGTPEMESTTVASVTRSHLRVACGLIKNVPDGEDSDASDAITIAFRFRLKDAASIVHGTELTLGPAVLIVVGAGEVEVPALTTDGDAVIFVAAVPTLAVASHTLTTAQGTPDAGDVVHFHAEVVHAPGIAGPATSAFDVQMLVSSHPGVAIDLSSVTCQPDACVSTTLEADGEGTGSMVLTVTSAAELLAEEGSSWTIDWIGVVEATVAAGIDSDAELEVVWDTIAGDGGRPADAPATSSTTMVRMPPSVANVVHQTSIHGTGSTPSNPGVAAPGEIIVFQIDVEVPEATDTFAIVADFGGSSGTSNYYEVLQGEVTFVQDVVAASEGSSALEVGMAAAISNGGRVATFHLGEVTNPNAGQDATSWGKVTCTVTARLTASANSAGQCPDVRARVEYSSALDQLIEHSMCVSVVEPVMAAHDIEHSIDAGDIKVLSLLLQHDSTAANAAGTAFDVDVTETYDDQLVLDGSTFLACAYDGPPADPLTDMNSEVCANRGGVELPTTFTAGTAIVGTLAGVATPSGGSVVVELGHMATPTVLHVVVQAKTIDQLTPGDSFENHVLVRFRSAPANRADPDSSEMPLYLHTDGTDYSTEFDISLLVVLEPTVGFAVDASDDDPTTDPSTTGNTLAIGEEVDLVVTTHIPESLTSLWLVIDVPAGMAVVEARMLTVGSSFVDPPVAVDAYATATSDVSLVSCNPGDVSGCYTEAAVGFWSYTNPSSGANLLVLNQGMIQNSPDNEWNDNDSMSFSIKLRVLNVLTNDGTSSGTTLTTKSSLWVADQSLVFDRSLSFTIAEPKLRVAVSQTTPPDSARVDARDDLSITATIDHAVASRAQVYHALIIADVPADVILLSRTLAVTAPEGCTTSTTYVRSDASTFVIDESTAADADVTAVGFTISFSNLAVGEAIELAYDVTVVDDVRPADVVPQPIQVTYSTMASDDPRAESDARKYQEGDATYPPAIGSCNVQIKIPEVVIGLGDEGGGGGGGGDRHRAARELTIDTGTSDSTTAGSDVTIGEEAAVVIEALVPEGRTSIWLEVSVPLGMAILAAEVEAIGTSFTDPPVVPGQMAVVTEDPNVVTCAAEETSTCYTDDTVGFWTYYDADTGQTTLVLNQGQLQNEPDNIEDDNDKMKFVVRLKILDVPSNDGVGGGTALTDTTQLLYFDHTKLVGDTVSFRVVEPQLQVAVSQTSPSGRVDGRDDVTLRATIDHSAVSTAQAYHGKATVEVPAEMILLARTVSVAAPETSAASVLFTRSDGSTFIVEESTEADADVSAVSFTISYSTLALGEQVVVTYDATVVDDIRPGQSIPQPVYTTYSTMPDSDPRSDADARVYDADGSTGSSSGYPRAEGSHDVVVKVAAIAISLDASSLVDTAGATLAIAELVEHAVTITVPETETQLVATVTFAPGLGCRNAKVHAVGAAIANSILAVSDRVPCVYNADSSTWSTVFDFGLIANVPDNANSANDKIVLKVTSQLLDIADGDHVVSHADVLEIAADLSTTNPEATEAARAATSVSFAEPLLQSAVAPDVTVGHTFEAGDKITFDVTISHEDNRAASAYDMSILVTCAGHVQVDSATSYIDATPVEPKGEISDSLLAVSWAIPRLLQPTAFTAHVVTTLLTTIPPQYHVSGVGPLCSVAIDYDTYPTEVGPPTPVADEETLPEASGRSYATSHISDVVSISAVNVVVQVLSTNIDGTSGSNVVAYEKAVLGLTVSVPKGSTLLKFDISNIPAGLQLVSVILDSVGNIECDNPTGTIVNIPDDAAEEGRNELLQQQFDFGKCVNRPENNDGGTDSIFFKVEVIVLESVANNAVLAHSEAAFADYAVDNVDGEVPIWERSADPLQLTVVAPDLQATIDIIERIPYSENDNYDVVTFTTTIEPTAESSATAYAVVAVVYVKYLDILPDEEDASTAELTQASRKATWTINDIAPGDAPTVLTFKGIIDKHASEWAVHAAGAVEWCATPPDYEVGAKCFDYGLETLGPTTTTTTTTATSSTTTTTTVTSTITTTTVSGTTTTVSGTTTTVSTTTTTITSTTTQTVTSTTKTTTTTTTPPPITWVAETPVDPLVDIPAEFVCGAGFLTGGRLFSLLTGDNVMKDPFFRTEVNIDADQQFQLVLASDSTILNTFVRRADQRHRQQQSQHQKRDLMIADDDEAGGSVGGGFGFSTSYGDPRSLIMVPGGRCFVLYVELADATEDAALVSLVVVELFANRSLATGFGEYILRARPWGPVGVGFASVPAEARKESHVLLTYTQDTLGNEYALVSSDVSERTYRVNLHSFDVEEVSVPRPALGATKFVWCPEGLYHDQIVYNLVAASVSDDGRVVTVYLSSSTMVLENAATAVASLEAEAAVNGLFTGAYTFKPDAISGPERTQVYLTTKTQLYELFWTPDLAVGKMRMRFSLIEVSEDDVSVQNEGSSCACDDIPVTGPASITPPRCFASPTSFPIRILNPSTTEKLEVKIYVTVNGYPATEMLVESSTLLELEGGGGGGSGSELVVAPIPRDWQVSVEVFDEVSVHVPAVMGDSWAVNLVDVKTNLPIGFSPQQATMNAKSCNIYCRDVECDAGSMMTFEAATTDMLCSTAPCSQRECCARLPGVTTIGDDDGTYGTRLMFTDGETYPVSEASPVGTLVMVVPPPLFSTFSSSGLNDGDSGMPVPVHYAMVVVKVTGQAGSGGEGKTGTHEADGDESNYLNNYAGRHTRKINTNSDDFVIDSVTGHIAVANGLDYETTPAYTIHLELTVPNDVAYPALRNMQFKATVYLQIVPSWCPEGTWSETGTFPCNDATSTTVTTTTIIRGWGADASMWGANFSTGCPVCLNSEQRAPNMLSCFARPYTFIPEGVCIAVVCLLVLCNVYHSKREVSRRKNSAIMEEAAETCKEGFGSSANQCVAAFDYSARALTPPGSLSKEPEALKEAPEKEGGALANTRQMTLITSSIQRDGTDDSVDDGSRSACDSTSEGDDDASCDSDINSDGDDGGDGDGTAADVGDSGVDEKNEEDGDGGDSSGDENDEHSEDGDVDAMIRRSFSRDAVVQPRQTQSKLPSESLSRHVDTGELPEIRHGTISS